MVKYIKLVYVLILFLPCGKPVYSQSDCDLYNHYNSTEVKAVNKFIISSKELELQTDGSLIKLKEFKFNDSGLPISIEEFDGSGFILKSKYFLYDSLNRPIEVTTHHKGYNISLTRFFYERNMLISCNEYIYNKKNTVFEEVKRREFSYDVNRNLTKYVEIIQPMQDTIEISLYLNNGFKTESKFNTDGYKVKKIEFDWDSAYNKMTEILYDSNAYPFDSIEHYYDSNLQEIKRIDESISKTPLYWVYNASGQVIETNEAVFYKQFNKYSENGLLIEKTFIPELNSGYDSLENYKVILYEYQLRGK